jgi:glycopeptide antibiotics resistance protein
MYHFRQIQHASNKRLVALVISVLFFYAWVAIGVIKRKQDSFFNIILQSSFYVYIFSVLTLTGYFVLFNQVSAHGWWQKILHRINLRDGVNLEPFLFMKGMHLLNYEVVGNFIMLLPLGIYLPLLYNNIRNFFTVTFAAMLVSVSIELMQLATSYRITDIDDVILNTAGASLGFIIYAITYPFLIKPLNTSQECQMYN